MKHSPNVFGLFFCLSLATGGALHVVSLVVQGADVDWLTRQAAVLLLLGSVTLLSANFLAQGKRLSAALVSGGFTCLGGLGAALPASATLLKLRIAYDTGAIDPRLRLARVTAEYAQVQTRLAVFAVLSVLALIAALAIVWRTRRPGAKRDVWPRAFAVAGSSLTVAAMLAVTLQDIPEKFLLPIPSAAQWHALELAAAPADPECAVLAAALDELPIEPTREEVETAAPSVVEAVTACVERLAESLPERDYCGPEEERVAWQHFRLLRLAESDGQTHGFERCTAVFS